MISPFFAKVFLHYVLDLWIQDGRKRQAKGEVVTVRYADDFVIGCREESLDRQPMDAVNVQRFPASEILEIPRLA